ncbi:MAG TPA: hypothetical protein VHN77_11265, partial [Phycisphaerales bacterium]|nr:hypothetical protein [Phycisphaerales bacterium]
MKTAGAIASLALCAAASAQTYSFTIQPATSSATWNASLNAPFQTSGTPTSFLWGNYDAVTNATGTRTLPGLF